MWAFAIPAAIAAAQYIDQRGREKEDRKMQAEMLKYSPWTGVAQSASAFNQDPKKSGVSMLGAGVLSGMAQSQASDQAEKAEANQKEDRNFRRLMLMKMGGYGDSEDMRIYDWNHTPTTAE